MTRPGQAIFQVGRATAERAEVVTMDERRSA
jgi:hypothetical protein